LRCVDRMFRRASLPPALSPSIYGREMNVAARLAQALATLRALGRLWDSQTIRASSEETLGNGGFCLKGLERFCVVKSCSGVCALRDNLRKYIAAPRPTGSVRIGQSLSETNNHCPKRTTARLTPRAIVRNGQSRCPRNCIVAGRKRGGKTVQPDRFQRRALLLQERP
jgi:hypothetical protein